MEKENLILEVKPEISTKEIENELIEKKVVSEEQVENSLNYEKLSDAEKAAIDEFREQGIKAGLLNVRVFRPFPGEEIA